MAVFDASGHRWCHSDCLVRFHKVVIREIQSDRSLKVFKFFAECIRETGQAAAMHPQSVVLFLDVGRCNPCHVRRTTDSCLFHFHDFPTTLNFSNSSMSGKWNRNQIRLKRHFQNLRSWQNLKLRVLKEWLKLWDQQLKMAKDFSKRKMELAFPPLNYFQI